MEDNIKEVLCRSVDWFKLAQGRERLRAFVNAVMNFRVP